MLCVLVEFFKDFLEKKWVGGLFFILLLSWVGLELLFWLFGCFMCFCCCWDVVYSWWEIFGVGSFWDLLLCWCRLKGVGIGDWLVCGVIVVLVGGGFKGCLLLSV